ncbi:MAG: PD-(D/E)XK nuclease family protein [Gemmatimonadaceae bacterium]
MRKTNGYHALGVQFVEALFRADGRSAPEILSLVVERQKKSIDVLLIINERLAVCIEDKAGSIEHSGQLARYFESLTRRFTAADIVRVYVQTFEQGTYEAVRGAGYALVSRKELIAILKPYALSPEPNDIARDFYSRLTSIDHDVESYRHQPVSTKWSPLAWQGFFCALQLRLPGGMWGYVPNRAGGFQGYWWYWKKAQGCEQYLQLEEETLCFKISVNQPETRAELRNAWPARLIEAGRAEALDVTRPRRLRSGQAMTVAVLAADYRATDNAGLIDMEATVARLRKAETVLDRASANNA